MSGSPDRRAELERGLIAVRRRIDTAAETAGRDPAELTLVVVTKTFPSSDVRLLHGLGVREMGESRDQEASVKAAELADLEESGGVRWHFVGRLQSNKARSVAGYAHAVHSLDRASLLSPLARGAREAGRELECFVQISLDDDERRGGVPGREPARLAELADAVVAEDGLRLVGVMAVAPLGADPDAAFGRLQEVTEALRERHPEAGRVSAGMSGDLEAAVRHGATHLRVGSAVLGKRPPPG